MEYTPLAKHPRRNIQKLGEWNIQHRRIYIHHRRNIQNLAYVSYVAYLCPKAPYI